MAALKQSISYTRTFMMIDSSDHVSGKTGLTVAVTLSKAGGSFASAGGTITEVANGLYKIALTTTDTNTLGDLAFHCTATGADPTDFIDQVTANNSDDVYSRLGAPAGASVSADVAAVKSDTGTILTDTVTILNDVNTGAGAIYTRLGAPAGASIAADIASNYARIGAPVGASISADIAGVPTTVWAKVIETGYTALQMMRLIGAVCCGKVSGLPGSPVFRSADDSADRVTATTDTNGNRSAVTLDAS